MKFRLIIFDWDGTLIDSVTQIVNAMQLALTELGCPPRTSQQVRAIIGLSLPETMQVLLPDADLATHTAVAARYRANYTQATDVTPSQLFPGAQEVVAELARRGYLLAIATAKSRVGLEHVLDTSGIRHLFQASRCAGEAPSKPHPEMLLQIMHELAVSPCDTLMVGDTAHDMQMAVNAGVPRLAVCYGAHERQQLLLHSPLACLDDVRAIPEWLGSN